jgi:hypothetical protein
MYDFKCIRGEKAKGSNKVFAQAEAFSILRISNYTITVHFSLTVRETKYTSILEIAVISHQKEKVFNIILFSKHS